MTTSFWSRVERRWCTIVHRKAMWPVHGQYRCSICLRTYPVLWEHDHAGMGAASESRSFVLAPAAFGRREAKLAGTVR